MKPKKPKHQVRIFTKLISLGLNKLFFLQNKTGHLPVKKNPKEIRTGSNKLKIESGNSMVTKETIAFIIKPKTIIGFTHRSVNR